MSVRVPKYRLHKGTGQALVQIDGHRIYLGKHGTERSRQKYRRIIAEWLGNGRQILPTRDRSASDLAVNEVILAYWKFAVSYYVKNGKTTDETHGIRAALRPLKELYGHELAATIGPRELKNVRQTMIESGHSRKYINDNVSRIKRAFRWAVENELYPPDRLPGLLAVQGLRKGRSQAKESRPVEPVSDNDVEYTLRYLKPVVRAMVRFQQLAGCRPGEVRTLRPQDVDTSGAVWVYRPESHKTEHTGRERRIFIGPRGQDILRPWLARPADQYCFSASESVRGRHQTNRESVAFPTTGQPATPNRCYTKDSYNRAIARACERAGVTKWTPNQLRHSRGTDVRRRFGLEAAQAVLGHSRADVTQVYAERDFDLAKRIMGDVG